MSILLITNNPETPGSILNIYSIFLDSGTVNVYPSERSSTEPLLLFCYVQLQVWRTRGNRRQYIGLRVVI